MVRSLPRIPIATAASICAAIMAPALCAQPARVPSSEVGPPAARFAAHPYTSALAAVGNYQSCGVNARRAAVDEVTRALQSIEAAAEAKGLGATLERLREEHDRLLAVSTMIACASGPRAALANARRALVAFRTWVDDQPARQ
jgi:hypothetical protein